MLNKEKLHQLHTDTEMKEAFQAFVKLLLDDAILAAAYKGETVVGAQQTFQLVQLAFRRLEELFTPEVPRTVDETAI
jgi:hypothetical protein